VKKIFIIFFVFFACSINVANAGTLYYGYDQKTDNIALGAGEKNDEEYNISGIIQKVYVDEDNIIRLEILGDYNKEYHAAIPVEWCFRHQTTPRKGESYESITKELLNWLTKRKEDEAVTRFRINEDGSAEVEYKDYNRKRPIYYYDDEIKKIYVSVNFPNDIDKTKSNAVQDKGNHEELYFSGRIKDVKITKDNNIKLVIQTAKNTFYTGTIYIYTYNGNKTTSHNPNRSLDYVFNKLKDCIYSFYEKGTIANFVLANDEVLRIACKKYDTNFADPIYSITTDKGDPTKEMVSILLVDDMEKNTIYKSF